MKCMGRKGLDVKWRLDVRLEMEAIIQADILTKGKLPGWEAHLPKRNGGTDNWSGNFTSASLHCCLLTQAFQLFLSECFFVSGKQLSTQQSREAGEKRWRREAVYFLTWREFTGGVKKSPAHPRLLLSQQHFPFGNTLLWHAGSVPVPPNV